MDCKLATAAERESWEEVLEAVACRLVRAAERVKPRDTSAARFIWVLASADERVAMVSSLLVRRSEVLIASADI